MHRFPSKNLPPLDSPTLGTVKATTTWLERHQVGLFLLALGIGAAVGMVAPSVAPGARLAAGPALGLLLYATFLSVPFAQIARGLTAWRFLATVLVVNFALVPMVVFALSRLVSFNPALLVGVVIVLLAPCVDYVIVFTGIAGGAQDRLLAITPVLMLAQVALIPLYLRLFIDGQSASLIDPAPFLSAFVWFIAVPLAAAIATQLLGRVIRPLRIWERAFGDAMVPLVMLVLTLVVASQIDAIRERLFDLGAAIGVFALYAAVMTVVALAVARAARLGSRDSRAVVFSGVTRNSLVVLPLVLALPAPLDLAPLVVVSQTLVELVAMVILVRLAPKLVPHIDRDPGDCDTYTKTSEAS